MPITPKNWTTFQHYRDRSPGWIKLHRTLLDNVDYHLLSPEAAKCLPLVWLIASEKDGIIPPAPELAFRLRISEPAASAALAELIARNFLVEAKPAERVATDGGGMSARDAPSSRHISDAVKRAVWKRDHGKCCHCGSEENIEYDHIIPVSEGGSGDEDNIQLLCRSCNRRKRNAATVEHVAPARRSGPLSRRSLEKEGEKRKEGEEDSPAPAGASPPRVPDRFDDFWKAYPRRDGANPRAPAEKKFKALVKSGVDPQMMIDAVTALAAAEAGKGNIGTKFIPQAVTWLNQQRWADHAAVAFLIAEKRSSPLVFIVEDSPEWRAWDAYLRATNGGRGSPVTDSRVDGVMKRGWYRPTAFPPGPNDEAPPDPKIEDAVRVFAEKGRWSRFAGPEPGLTGCRASAELLAKYGMLPDGRKIQKQDEPA